MASNSDLDFLEYFKQDAVVTAECTTHVEYHVDRFRRIPRQKVERKWYRERVAGRGAFGEVWLEVEREHGLRNQRAVKIVNKSAMRGRKIDYRKELLALAKFSKPQYRQEEVLVDFLGWYEDDTNLFISMEYFSLGDLEPHITASITIDDVKDITTNLLTGLRIMHSEGFAHRDLKPSNIFVVEKPPASNWWVKIGDFGISKRVRSDETAFRTSLGTSAYQAPEVGGYFETDDPTSVYDNAVDIWSLGCVIYKIATETELFPRPRDLMRFCENRVPFPDQLLLAKLDKDGVDFVKSLVIPNPRERISAEKGLGGLWLSQGRRRAIPQPEEESFERFVSSMTETAGERRPGGSYPIGKIGESMFSNEIIRMMKRLRLKNHTSDFRAMTYSSDGKVVASASDKRTIPFPDSATGAVRRALEPDIESALKIAFFSNDKEIAFLSKDTMVAFAHRSAKTQFWNTERHHTIFMRKEVHDPVLVIAFSSNDEMTASAYVARIRLWCLKSGTTRRILKRHPSWVLAIAFSSRVVSSGQQSNKFWKSPTGSMRQTLDDATSWASIIAFSSDDKMMAFASDDQTIQLWECAMGVTRRKLQGCIGGVLAIKFLSQDQIVAAAFHDQTIKFWDSATGTLQTTIENLDPVKVDAFSPSGSTVAFGLAGEECNQLWDLIFNV